MDEDGRTLSLDAREEQEQEQERDERRVYLRDGRTVAVSEQQGEDIVEIRASGGAVELRVRVTEDGPVLQLDGVRLQMKATESVEVDCKRFSVKASEKAEIRSEGELELESEKELKVESTDDVRLRGKLIHLN